MNKDTSKTWKNKLRAVQKARKLEKQRIKRLEERIKYLKSELADYKKKNESLERRVQGVIDLGEIPSGYQYETGIIRMGIELQVIENLSYRQCSRVIQRTFDFMSIKRKAPDPSTIRQWVLKQGCYKLEESSCSPGEHVLMVDESAGIGQEKGLLVLGVNLDKWEKEPKALSYSDVEVLELGSQKSWNKEGISKKIEQASEKVNNEIAYIISDRASNIKSGIELSGKIHIPDCTHWMSSCMEKYYKKDAHFKVLQTHLGKVRQKMVNGKHVGMIAPHMQAKARFLNLYTISSWMDKLLKNWTNLSKIEQEKVFFLQTEKALVEEVIEITRLVKELSILLKTEGIVEGSRAKIKEIFSFSKYDREKIRQFEQDMLFYVESIQSKLPDRKKILCCSDIIESHFGKMKNRGNKAVSKGITEDMLSMTLFKGQLTNEQVQKGMEMMNWKKVQKWTEENMALSFPKMKKLFWTKIAS